MRFSEPCDSYFFDLGTLSSVSLSRRSGSKHLHNLILLLVLFTPAMLRGTFCFTLGRNRCSRLPLQ